MRIYGDEGNAIILREIGERIQQIRVGKGMTQQELAQEAGVSFSTMTRIERGEGVQIEKLMLVMRVLGLLQNMNLLIPEQELSPEELYKGGKRRMRASKMQNQTVSEWKWGDER